MWRFTDRLRFVPSDLRKRDWPTPPHRLLANIRFCWPVPMKADGAVAGRVVAEDVHFRSRPSARRCARFAARRRKDSAWSARAVVHFVSERAASLRRA